MSSSSAEPRDVVTRYVEAARDGMSAVIASSWEYPGDLPLSGTYHGVEAIVHTLHAARAFFPELIQGLSETQQLPDTGANCGPEAAALSASRHSRRSARSAGAPETRSRRVYHTTVVR